MTALIIDNMTIARAIINQLTFEVGDLTIICKYCTATEAYKHLENKSIGLLYPHKKSSDTQCLELAGNVRQKDTVLVFITSGKDTSRQELSPALTEYMISSQGPARFLPTAKPQQEMLREQQNEMALRNNDECVFIRDNSVIRRLKIDDIQYAEAMGDYVKFHTAKKMYTIHCTLKSVEQRLCAANFIRVHRSFIVALNKLDSMQNGGVIIGDRFIPVADNYRKILCQRMNIL